MFKINVFHCIVHQQNKTIKKKKDYEDTQNQWFQNIVGIVQEEVDVA